MQQYRLEMQRSILMKIEVIRNFSSPRNDNNVCQFGCWISKYGVEIPIFKITSFYLLTQFVGYAKYANRKNGDVFFRGQSSLYEDAVICKREERYPGYQCSLTPSLFRKNRVVGKVFSKLATKIANMEKENKHLNGMCNEKLYPLLQHYGIKTQWIDVVDNLWVALWFATHNFKSIYLKSTQYIQTIEKKDGYAFLFLILSDTNRCSEDNNEPGIYKGEYTTLVDLRKALPSFYLRPHAQHAYMIKKNDFTKIDDYSDLLTAIIAIPIEDAFSWIGKSGLLSVQSLFPSPYNDCGYQDLLRYVRLVKNPTKMDIDYYGTINLIGSDYLINC